MIDLDQVLPSELDVYREGGRKIDPSYRERALSVFNKIIKNNPYGWATREIIYESVLADVFAEPFWYAQDSFTLERPSINIDLSISLRNSLLQGMIETLHEFDPL